jgi:hypothetical protein
MGNSKKDSEVEQVVVSKGDEFVAYTPARRNNSEDGGKSSNQKISFICGICGTEETIGYGSYKSSDGGCKKCRNTRKGSNQTNNTDEIIQFIEYSGLLKVLRLEGKKYVMTCGKHTFKRTWPEYRSTCYCSECNKLKSSVKHNAQKLYIEQMEIRKNDKKPVVSKKKIKSLKTISIPEGYSLVEHDGSIIIARCQNNHVFKVNGDIKCLHDNLTAKQIKLRSTQEYVETKISSVQGDKLLSRYGNKQDLLEIQCSKCNSIFYKSLNTYISDSNRCNVCADLKKLNIQKENRIVEGNYFKNYVEEQKWIFLGDITLYEDQNTKFNAQCPKGHNQMICRLTFYNGKCRCVICANEKRSEANRLSSNEVSLICEQSGFKLLEKYINRNKKMDMKCLNCNKNVKMIFETMKNGKCPKCNSSKSAGELRIHHILKLSEFVNFQESEFTFDTNYTIKDDWFFCKDINYLRYDFRVVLINGVELFIEFDGIQHFKSIEFFGGDVSFEKRRRHDLMKSAYCDYHGKVLLRIASKDYNRVRSIVNKCIEQLMDKKCIVSNYMVYSDEDHYQHFKNDYLNYEPPDNLS